MKILVVLETVGAEQDSASLVRRRSSIQSTQSTLVVESVSVEWEILFESDSLELMLATFASFPLFWAFI